jgi:hypothetical protein
MKAESRQLIWATIIGCAVILVSWNAFGMGADHPNDGPVSVTTAWPEGMHKLINASNRVHGYFINQADIFFFSGNATNLSAFLADYSKISGVEKHRLILHEGVGEAKSPWGTTGRPCDWKLFGYSKDWHNQSTLKGTNSVETLQTAAKESVYVLEVHLWTGGRITLDEVVVPKNVEVTKYKSP